MSLLLALALQVGPNPLGGAMPGDDLVRDRPARRDGAAAPDAGLTSAWFEGCLAQLEADPARANAMAQIRRAETTGTDRVLANLCLGTASSQLGLWDEARTAFAAARAETPEDETRARARFAALAGNAALASGDAAGALELLTLAERDARAAKAETLEAIAAIDRARALVALEREDEALAALESATTLAPERAEGWLLKATLLRRMEKLAEAQAAIERAAALTPKDAEIGVEAGVIALLSGRYEAARASWRSVVELAPDGPFAATARQYLAQLDEASESEATQVPPPAPPPPPAPQEQPR
ncbi:tetratricopeptide repeat protein [Erythrobacter sp. NE805]|uniref:tetratricopeptide repeat protein n=1 Tax=Erythrobacter sp. NE805 TaxID=3389875 RepID=UPI00396B0A50